MNMFNQSSHLPHIKEMDEMSVTESELDRELAEEYNELKKVEKVEKVEKLKRMKMKLLKKSKMINLKRQ